MIFLGCIGFFCECKRSVMAKIPKFSPEEMSIKHNPPICGAPYCIVG